MNKYIIKQLIKEKDSNKIFGYELLFESNDDSLYNSDSSAADAVANFLLQNNSAIFDGRLTFITLTPTLLFRNTPKMFDKEQTVIQIGMNVIIHPLAESFVKRYKENGYSFAIDDFQFSPKCFSMLEYADYVKISFGDYPEIKSESNIKNIIDMAHGFNKKVIATDIEDEEVAKYAKAFNFDYLQGSFVGDSFVKKVGKIEYLQSNFFSLIVSISKDEIDLDEIESIISRDAGLSYSLLKMANSIHFGLRKKTNSIRNAIVTIGIQQLKQWVYLLSFTNDDGNMDEDSEELLKLSFTRASFAQGLQKYITGFELTGPECYMMGMFSTLNYMMDAPMEEILQELSLDEKITAALLNYDGEAGKLLKLVISYEKADWKTVKSMSKELSLPNGVISQCYMDCVEEVNEIWRGLTSSIDDTDTVDLLAEGEKPAKKKSSSKSDAAEEKKPAKKPATRAKKTTKAKE